MYILLIKAHYFNKQGPLLKLPRSDINLKNLFCKIKRIGVGNVKIFHVIQGKKVGAATAHIITYILIEYL